jgi:aspartate aminotransferase
MMFRTLPVAPADPILSLSAAFERDPDPRKIDLGIGVYRDESGRSPVLASVKRAEGWLLEHQTTKSYLSSAGAPEFNDALGELLLGVRSAGLSDHRVRCLQTPGGSGALRVIAEFIRGTRPRATVWVPRPSWANHMPILQAAGVTVREYGYYDRDRSQLTFDTMLADLGAIEPNDLLLIHGCCHNPSGADLSMQQWEELARALSARGGVPLVDIAYQGFASGPEEDARGLRVLADALPELLVASSCSKNFSLYRERTGAACVVAANAADADKAAGAMLGIVRALYSMPPDHGASVVAHILATPALRAQWAAELATMRERIRAIRGAFAQRLSAAAERDFSYLERQNGMFSFLNLTAAQVEQLRTRFHIHAVGTGRINVAGLTRANVAYAAEAVAAVMR